MFVEFFGNGTIMVGLGSKTYWFDFCTEPNIDLDPVSLFQHLIKEEDFRVDSKVRREGAHALFGALSWAGEGWLTLLS